MNSSIYFPFCCQKCILKNTHLVITPSYSWGLSRARGTVPPPKSHFTPSQPGLTHLPCPAAPPPRLRVPGWGSVPAGITPSPEELPNVLQSPPRGHAAQPPLPIAIPSPFPQDRRPATPQAMWPHSPVTGYTPHPRAGRETAQSQGLSSAQLRGLTQLRVGRGRLPNPAHPFLVFGNKISTLPRAAGPAAERQRVATCGSVATALSEKQGEVYRRRPGRPPAEQTPGRFAPALPAPCPPPAPGPQLRTLRRRQSSLPGPRPQP